MDYFIPEPVPIEIVEIVSRQKISVLTWFAQTFPEFSAEMGDVFEILTKGNLERENPAIRFVKLSFPRKDNPYLDSVGYMGSS